MAYTGSHGGLPGFSAAAGPTALPPLSARSTRSRSASTQEFAVPHAPLSFFRSTVDTKPRLSARDATPSAAGDVAGTVVRLHGRRRVTVAERNASPFVHRGVLTHTTSCFPDAPLESITHFCRSPRKTGRTGGVGPPMSAGRCGPRLQHRPPLCVLEDIDSPRPDDRARTAEISEEFAAELAAFEATLGAEHARRGVDGACVDGPPAQANRDYHLLKILFRMALLDNSGATRVIQEIGEDEIIRRLEVMKERYGARRMNREEFHLQLRELLGTPTSRLDSDVLFDLFDHNCSGFVDECEFMSGMRMTLHDKDRTIAAHCRRLLESRMASGTVVSMMEATLMLRAVAAVCEGRFPGVTSDVEQLLSVLHPQSHHSQLPLLFFRNSVLKTQILSTAMQTLTPDAALPPLPPRSPSPDPERDVAAATGLGYAVPAAAAAAAAAAVGCSQLRPTAPPAADGGLPASGTPATTRPTSRAESRQSGSADAATRGGVGASSSSGKPDVMHRRFRADAFLRPQQEAEPHPAERHNPQWVWRDGVVWFSSDLHGPMAMA